MLHIYMEITLTCVESLLLQASTTPSCNLAPRLEVQRGWGGGGGGTEESDSKRSPAEMVRSIRVWSHLSGYSRRRFLHRRICGPDRAHTCPGANCSQRASRSQVPSLSSSASRSFASRSFASRSIASRSIASRSIASRSIAANQSNHSHLQAQVEATTKSSDILVVQKKSSVEFGNGLPATAVYIFALLGRPNTPLRKKIEKVWRISICLP